MDFQCFEHLSFEFLIYLGFSPDSYRGRISNFNTYRIYIFCFSAFKLLKYS